MQVIRQEDAIQPQQRCLRYQERVRAGQAQWHRERLGVLPVLHPEWAGAGEHQPRIDLAVLPTQLLCPSAGKFRDRFLLLLELGHFLAKAARAADTQVWLSPCQRTSGRVKISK